MDRGSPAVRRMRMLSTLTRVVHIAIMSALTMACNAELASPSSDAGPATDAAPPAFAVTGIYPTIGPHHPGDRLTIVGRGFGDPPDDVLVAFGSTTAAIVPGGNDRELIVVIPALSPGTYSTLIIPRGGQSIALPPITLENFRSTVPDGTLWVALTEAPSGTIQAGARFELGFGVWSYTSLDEVYGVSCSTNGGWSVATAPAELALPGTDTFLREPGAGFRVQVDVPPDAAGEVRLRCRVAAKHNLQLEGTTGDIRLAVGAAFPAARAIPIGLSTIASGAGRGAAGTHELAVVEPGTPTFLGFDAVVRKAGSYTVTASFADNAGGAWSAVTPQKILMELPAQMGLRVAVTAASGALPTHLIVTIRSDEDPYESGEYLVRLAPTP